MQKGRRRENEDRYVVEKLESGHVIVAVFDGHGNDLCAQFGKDNFVRCFKSNLEKHKLSTGEALKKAVRTRNIQFCILLNLSFYASVKISFLRDIDEKFKIQANSQDHNFEEFVEDESFEMISERRNREARDYHKSGSTVTAVAIEGNAIFKTYKFKHKSYKLRHDQFYTISYFFTRDYYILFWAEISNVPFLAQSKRLLLIPNKNVSFWPK